MFLPLVKSLSWKRCSGLQFLATRDCHGSVEEEWLSSSKSRLLSLCQLKDPEAGQSLGPHTHSGVKPPLPGWILTYLELPLLRPHPDPLLPTDP